MLYRDHRGSLEDSMKTVVQLPATLTALAVHIGKELGYKIYPADIDVRPYFGYDERIGWDTHIVLFCGRPAGFTNFRVMR